MNALLRVRLSKPAVPQRKAKPCAVTVRAINKVIADWHIAGCRHALKGTTPADQLPTDGENETLQALYRAARVPETAIRIIHKPSGIVVTCQDERSQQQNKLRALHVLRAKLYEAEQERLAKERGDLRRGQIGSGDRSEKIRTYNFPQSRITDHRIGKDAHNTATVMDGDIQDMIDALNQEEQARKIARELGQAAGG